MELEALQQAERRIWETIKEVAPACTGIEAADPWKKDAPTFQYPVGIYGQGLLDWLPERRINKLRSVASGPIKGDQLQLILVFTADQSTALNTTLTTTSSWSRAGIPLGEAFTWPEGVVLGKGEERAALGGEVDYLCLFITRAEGSIDTGHLLAFKASEYRRQEILLLGARLQDPDFLQAYETLGGVREQVPRYVRRYATLKPANDFLVVPCKRDPSLALDRVGNRLFSEHRVLEVLNRHNQIIGLTKDEIWQPSSI